jgi:DNA gyrase/topoisomerase IV subunit B
MAVSAQYNAEAIEVLTGLDPVRKRPGMYTDTTRPNHLAQEVIDNAWMKPCRPRAPSTWCCTPGSVGGRRRRGMPVDIHPEQGKRHSGRSSARCAGGKFRAATSFPAACTLGFGGQRAVAVRYGQARRQRLSHALRERQQGLELEIIDSVAGAAAPVR